MRPIIVDDLMTKVCNEILYNPDNPQVRKKNIEEKDDNMGFPIASKYFYCESFFYLYLSYGSPARYDEYKQAGEWTLRYKDVYININFSSSKYFFRLYSKKQKFTLRYNPYAVRLRREIRKYRDVLMPNMLRGCEPANDKQKQEWDSKWVAFLVENNAMEMEEEEFNKADLRQKWFDLCEDYNKQYLTSYEDFVAQVGEKYSEYHITSQHKYYLRIFRRFLKDLLKPEYVRDVPYNILGRLNDDKGNETKSLKLINVTHKPENPDE